MIAHFPHLSKLGGKLLEIAGAVCASACVALLLGNLRDPPYPPAPSIVRLAPANEQVIHTWARTQWLSSKSCAARAGISPTAGPEGSAPTR